MITATKKQVEYRIERMPFQEHPEAHITELLERLTELGKQGWHVVSVDLTYHPSYSLAAQPGVPVPVLLEREVEEQRTRSSGRGAAAAAITRRTAHGARPAVGPHRTFASARAPSARTSVRIASSP